MPRLTSSWVTVMSLRRPSSDNSSPSLTRRSAISRKLRARLFVALAGEVLIAVEFPILAAGLEILPDLVEFLVHHGGGDLEADGLGKVIEECALDSHPLYRLELVLLIVADRRP